MMWGTFCSRNRAAPFSFSSSDINVLGLTSLERVIQIHYLICFCNLGITSLPIPLMDIRKKSIKLYYISNRRIASFCIQAWMDLLLLDKSIWISLIRNLSAVLRKGWIMGCLAYARTPVISWLLIASWATSHATSQVSVSAVLPRLQIV